MYIYFFLHLKLLSQWKAQCRICWNIMFDFSLRLRLAILKHVPHVDILNKTITEWWENRGRLKPEGRYWCRKSRSIFQYSRLFFSPSRGFEDPFLTWIFYIFSCYIFLIKQCNTKRSEHETRGKDSGVIVRCSYFKYNIFSVTTSFFYRKDSLA